MSQHLIFGLPATALLFLFLALALRRTQNLHAEAAKRQEAEEALKHGQRLEALGPLTGGGAPGFHNLLTLNPPPRELLRPPPPRGGRRPRRAGAVPHPLN